MHCMFIIQFWYIKCLWNIPNREITAQTNYYTRGDRDKLQDFLSYQNYWGALLLLLVNWITLLGL